MTLVLTTVSSSLNPMQVFILFYQSSTTAPINVSRLSEQNTTALA